MPSTSVGNIPLSPQLCNAINLRGRRSVISTAQQSHQLERDTSRYSTVEPCRLLERAISVIQQLSNYINNRERHLVISTADQWPMLSTEQSHQLEWSTSHYFYSWAMPSTWVGRNPVILYNCALWTIPSTWEVDTSLYSADEHCHQLGRATSRYSADEHCHQLGRATHPVILQMSNVINLGGRHILLFCRWALPSTWEGDTSCYSADEHCHQLFSNDLHKVTNVLVSRFHRLDEAYRKWLFFMCYINLNFL